MGFCWFEDFARWKLSGDPYVLVIFVFGGRCKRQPTPCQPTIFWIGFFRCLASVSCFGVLTKLKAASTILKHH